MQQRTKSDGNGRSQEAASEAGAAAVERRRRPADSADGRVRRREMLRAARIPTSSSGCLRGFCWGLGGLNAKCRVTTRMAKCTALTIAAPSQHRFVPLPSLPLASSRFL